MLESLEDSAWTVDASLKSDESLRSGIHVGLSGLARIHRIEQNMLPLWQPLSTVAPTLAVMEIPSREGYWDEDRPA